MGLFDKNIHTKYYKWSYNSAKTVVESKGYTLIDNDYVNYKNKMTFSDFENYVYYMSFCNLIKGCTPCKFHKSNPNTIYNIKNWCTINNKSFKLLDKEYFGNNKALKWRCLKDSCGDIFCSDLNHILRDRGCGVCHGKQVGLSNNLAVVNPKLVKEWDYNKNGDLTPNNITANSRKYVWWICKENHSWKSKIATRNRGSGCPKCNISKGEEKVKQFLIKKSIKYIREFTFDDLTGIKNGLLRFDFAIFNSYNKLKLLIEYDGEFHFKKIHKNDKFEILQQHDKLKNDYCNNNNIKLLRIPYWDFNKIEEILLKEIN